MSTRRLIFQLVVLALILSAAGLAADEPLTIRYEKYTLPNGLDVILHIDHSLPVAAVNIWYHVGSRNEKPGRTGFAHLFEHIMFQGSQHFDGEYFEPLQKIGGRVNGSTGNDRTNYWEDVPSNHVELSLAMESDRMGYLLEALTQEKLDVQRDVVKNERRQSVDNRPYGQAGELLVEMMYPPEHPYSWSVIGSMDDLSAASLEDVKEFFSRYYTPNNASLCVAGDIDPEVVKPMIEKYFGTIPPGPEVTRPEIWIPRLDGVKRIVSQDDVELPRLYMAWHTPGYMRPGDAEFDLIANALSSGKTSRLYQALVYDQRIAQDVSAYQGSRRMGSNFVIQATAAEGHTLEELETAIDAELTRLLEGGLTQEELTQAQTNWESNFIQSLQSVGGFGGKADRLNQYNTYLGSPDMLQYDLDRYVKPTLDDVMAYAHEYLDMERRGILHIVPRGDYTVAEVEVDRSVKPEPMPEPEFTPPSIQEATLDNGIQVLLVEDHRLPLVDLELVINRGSAANPPDKAALAELTADMLNEGTDSRTALEIANESKRLAAGLRTRADLDATTISLDVIKRNLDSALILMADITLNPTFPEDELDRLRQQYLGRIRQNKRNPVSVGYDAFFSAMYGETHPYGLPSGGTTESINAITRQDLVDFYEANYFPNVSAIVASGDLTLDELVEKLEAHFGNWRTGEPAEILVEEPAPLEGSVIYLLDKPGAEQSFVMVGNPGMARDNPDRDAFLVMNRALGGQFTSRINLNLREDKGYTYGARSSIWTTRHIGPFMARSQVQAEFTKESVFEFLRELTDINTTRPLTEEELVDAKEGMIQGFSQAFQDLGAITASLSTLVQYELPLDTWVTYPERVAAVTLEAASEAAQKYIHTDRFVIVVVGDKELVEPGLRELGVGEIVYMN